MSAKITKFHKSSKAYWSLLKTFLNNEKIPLIPPLYHQGSFITNFKVKPGLFNSFFASQCSLMKNGSKLPSYLSYNNDNRLSTVNFSIDDIAKIIPNLDTNKACGHARSVFECSNYVLIQSASHWSSSSNKLNWFFSVWMEKRSEWFQFIKNMTNNV